MAEPVSMRAAAAAIGVPESTFRGLIRRERTLAECVVGRGPRGAQLFDLERLRRAWAALQGPEPAGLSDRAQYELQRRRRLWWECCAAQQQVADLEESLVDALEAESALAADLAELRQAAAEWAAAIADEVAGLDQAAARQHLQRSIVGQLQQLTAAHLGGEPTPAPTLASIAMPDTLPTLWQLRAELERCKGRLAQLQLQQERGELELGANVCERFFVAGRQQRDAWQRVGEQLALQTRRMASPESVRTAALQTLSAAGLI